MLIVECRKAIGLLMLDIHHSILPAGVCDFQFMDTHKNVEPLLENLDMEDPFPLSDLEMDMVLCPSCQCIMGLHVGLAISYDCVAKKMPDLRANFCMTNNF